MAVAKEQGATTVAIVDNRTSAMAQLADHVLLSKTESVSFFQSMSGPLAVLNALAAEIAALGEEQVRDRMDASQRMFDRLGVVWHDICPLPELLTDESQLEVPAAAERPRRTRTGTARARPTSSTDGRKRRTEL
jgi:glucosamine 6-phosphate synthetase-like amidotransferase/phosphosugar isomerase protein